MFTVHVLLDTFVITRVYGDQTSSAGSGTSVMTEEEEAVSTGNSYKDENISVTVSEYRENDTDIYVADVQLSSPEYLQTALAQGVYGRNVKEETSTIAENNNAILAVNGDYYGAREAGYVIKNGELLRNTSAGREDLVIYEDGSWKIVSENEVSAEELLRRPEITLRDLEELCPGLNEGSDSAALLAQTEVKYTGYLEKEQDHIRKAGADFIDNIRAEFSIVKLLRNSFDLNAHDRFLFSEKI